ncbi:MAG: glutamine-hydrolyzing carbamoyl-phosphate synthase small subunit [Arenicellales bacterium]|jgi:carbamoyl-phosphate synthase small subunit|nr:carbamoyl-phosphate synthase small subunit [Acidiferrobacteraceae bacterium]MDP7220044.1 glutamine-hydrolyzing carbamoyl-phosphate synthase small subunit [Arenicellales bacterium]HCF74176.1 carbamoyl-phosphate synthase small subunit [Gammaproteobacteria bacterium]
MPADQALLVLEDGTVFEGWSIGACGETSGEVVFNTAMTGYQEILSDPSYARQIITLTYPHVGNTGINCEDHESWDRVPAGLVIRDLPRRVSSYRSSQSLPEFLRAQGIVAISGIDTRKLTRLLRQRGSQNGCIQAGQIDSDRALAKARSFPGLKGMDLAREVTTKRSYQWHEGGWQPGSGFAMAGQWRFHVTAYDFGIKHNILRLLVDEGCEVTVVPADTTADEVLAGNPDGVFLSNGPGDPEPCTYAISAIRQILHSGIPIFGICLGHQLLALASGARTLKMKFGHHGANHPVVDLASRRVFITSQNHGFSIDPETLPESVKVTHRSLFDQSIQGIELTDHAAFSFQGHPEASPGPQDISSLFERFAHMMSKVAKARCA